ncbi:MAG: PhzF family phenazine biosynthesis protein [Pseudomonadales bacterium]|nr:PhzF family phenazine biosynthesis protein [Pseudomonadales bacterium]
MKFDIFQVDAFCHQVFSGNPAAVVPLKTWLSDQLLQAIAAENNLAETAFYIPCESGFHIRWFTPTVEVDLCGHATLAAAYVLFEQFNYAKEKIIFASRSGPLSVTQSNNLFTLNFPEQKPQPCETPTAIIKALGLTPLRCLKNQDYIAVLENEKAVAEVEVNLSALKDLDLRGLIITAEGENSDFVSRFFAPNFGIDEDAVTGSAHTQLAPYWAQVLGKNTLTARQLSRRGGELYCELKDQRVLISGSAALYMQGSIHVAGD